MEDGIRASQQQGCRRERVQDQDVNPLPLLLQQNLADYATASEMRAAPRQSQRAPNQGVAASASHLTPPVSQALKSLHSGSLLAVAEHLIPVSSMASMLASLLSPPREDCKQK